MFFFKIDTSGLDFIKTLDKILEDTAKTVNRDLATMMYGHAIEMAQEKLHSRRQMFVDGLKIFEEEGVWVLSLDAKVSWIDDGMGEHSMLDSLLSSKKAKRAKDGSTYVVVPFNHGPGKGAGSSTPAQMSLINTIKAEMKKKDIPWGKLETNSDGSAKLGRLHSFDIKNNPKKTAEGPGQGHGRIGDPKSGPTGIPFLQGVTVSQRKQKDGSIRKDISTFRIASSKHKGQSLWDHPGLDPVNIFDETMSWAGTIIQDKIVPRIMAEIDQKIQNL